LQFQRALQKAEGGKPCIVFNGEPWSQNPRLGRLKSLLLDFFRGKVVEAVNLAGLDHVISLTVGGGLSVAGAVEANGSSSSGQGMTVHFRVYAIKLLKSGSRLPRVELQEIGPRADLTLRREKEADAAMMKEAMKIPKESKVCVAIFSKHPSSLNFFF
jgi:ribosome production factor 2